MRYLEEILVLDEEVARITVQKGKLQSIHQKVFIHQMFVILTASCQALYCTWHALCN